MVFQNMICYILQNYRYPAISRLQSTHFIKQQLTSLRYRHPIDRFVVQTIQWSWSFITSVAPVFAFSVYWATAIWQRRLGRDRVLTGPPGLWREDPCHCVSSLSGSHPGSPPAGTNSNTEMSAWSSSSSSWPTTSASSWGSGWSPSVHSPPRHRWGATLKIPHYVPHYHTTNHHHPLLLLNWTTTAQMSPATLACSHPR